MRLNKLITKIFFITTFIFLINSCSKEQCLNCNTYDMFSFNKNLEQFKDSIYICESDDMWEDIVWGEYSNGQGGDFSFIDLDIYTLGYRIIENVDIDNDGILNENDDDIDNDGILNYEDTSPYGIEDSSIIELIICTK